MTTVVEYRDVPLKDLVISRAQVRTTSPNKGLEELVESIRALGLLQPIVVCGAREEGKWEILTGQRRFLACQELGRETIPAAVLSESVSEEEAKAISITENLIRRQLSGRELTDGITYLYNHYGTVKAVAEATGLSPYKVRDHVKYPRLSADLKQLVDEGVVDINAAVRAQDASSDERGDADPDVAVKLAREMSSMSGVQRKKLTKERMEHPEKPVDEAIEEAKTGSKVMQIKVTVTQDTHSALRKFATEEGTNQDEAAASLIEEALVGRGLLDG